MPRSKSEFKAKALEVLRAIEKSGEARVITDHGKPTLGHGAAAQKIDLIANAAEKHVPHGVGADLTGQIDLQG